MRHFLRKIDTLGLFIEDAFWDDGATPGIPAVPEILNPDGTVNTPAVPMVPAFLGNPIPSDMIATPVPGGFFHPKWNNSVWVEGADPVLMAAQSTAAQAAALAANIQALWQAAHDYEYAQISGVAVGLLVLGVLQAKPKAVAVQAWSKNIWALYYTRKPTITSTLNPAMQDFSSVGAIPYSIQELMAELGI